MPVEKRDNKTDAQRRAQNKYDAANMTVLGCKVRRDEADAFKEACRAAGTTPNAVFRQAMLEFLKKTTAPE